MTGDDDVDRVSVGIIASAILVPLAMVGLGFLSYTAYKKRHNRPAATNNEIDQHFPTSDDEMHTIASVPRAGDGDDAGGGVQEQTQARQQAVLPTTDEIPQVTPSSS